MSSEYSESEFVLHPQLEKDTFFVGALNVSNILLMNDNRYPWIILVPRIHDVCDLTDLTLPQRTEFTEEINHVAGLMKQAYQPDRLNIGMLGNVVPQLHCHIIARFNEDFAWAKPVWGIGETIPYTKEQQEKIIPLLQKLLLS
ncbi:MAG: HIT family protein [Pyrinomonadaceae bacterium]|nr:HIT family protein [Pyrinomonadaceae bacterium]